MLDLGSPFVQVVNPHLDLQFVSSSIENVVGGFQNDTVTGNALDNRIEGGAGDDVLNGAAGDDLLIGGPGNDQLDGGADNDTFEFDTDSQLGTDTLTDPSGVDTLDFSPTGTLGVEVDLSLIAQTVNPHLKLQIGLGTVFERLTGGDKDDLLTGNAADNLFTGGLGSDAINGGGGNNWVLETRDADFVLTDADLKIGSEDNALASIQRVYLAGGDGANTMDASAFTLGSVFLLGGGGNDLLIGTMGNDWLLGDDGEDELRGGDGSDFLSGGAGSDDIYGGGGNDDLAGDGENDRLFGGSGDDEYIFDQANPLGSDRVIEAAGEGNDTLVGIDPDDIDLGLPTLQVISDDFSLVLQDLNVEGVVP
jgi:Ca2+-binding RTX toxin-like protein